MYLAEADRAGAARIGAEEEARRLPSDRWIDFPYSSFSHHGGACCDRARAWVVAMDFAQLDGSSLTSGPRWLRQRYKWGPSPWPMHWCEAVSRKTIDCGAHAALAREVFAARGHVAFPVQLVQRYSRDATEQWGSKWAQEDVSCHWLDDEHIYHEAAALLVGSDAVKIWDASSGSWVDPRQDRGYGSVSAVRLWDLGRPGTGDDLVWGERRLRANVWNQLG